ncbi:MAG TPA: DUF2892 domain-containing protein [Flavisolibacter sp.]|nr:DUF2892 domain-containing protein [Flavisolibacter sp.]
MKSNLGSADRIIRLLIAAAIVVLYFLDLINGTIATVLLIIAAVLALTAIINFCPLYRIFGLRTNKKL